MVITEVELRELWRSGRHPLPAFPPGTRFSPAAQDFIKDHELEIHFADPPQSPIPTSQLPTTDPQLPATFLRARLDRLHALAGLVAAEARRNQLPALAARLDLLAEDCRQLPAANDQRTPAPPLPLLPPQPAGASTFGPGPHDHVILHWLNFLRATVRELEVSSLAAQPPGPAASLRRLSDAVYDLELRVRSGELAWNSPSPAAASK
jgi:hypothetical protein